jgi:NarL family two-component system response regulator LiaR
MATLENGAGAFPLPRPGASSPLRSRVLIADDDPLARRVVRDTLQGAGGFAVVADAANGAEAIELALHYRPDVVVLEYALPRMDGLLVTRKIVQGAPEVRVLNLSSSTEEDIVFHALRAGASGFLSKEMEIASLPAAVRGLLRGEAAVPRALTMRLIERLRRVPESATGLRPVRSVLTSREWEVIDLLAQGVDPAGVADELVLSHETISTHMKNLRRKLGARSTADAIAAAERLRQPFA